MRLRLGVSPDSQWIGGCVWVGDAQPLPVDPSVLWSIPLLTAPKHGPAAWYLSDLNIATCAHIYEERIKNYCGVVGTRKLIIEYISYTLDTLLMSYR